MKCDKCGTENTGQGFWQSGDQKQSLCLPCYEEYTKCNERGKEHDAYEKCDYCPDKIYTACCEEYVKFLEEPEPLPDDIADLLEYRMRSKLCVCDMIKQYNLNCDCPRCEERIDEYERTGRLW